MRTTAAIAVTTGLLLVCGCDGEGNGGEPVTATTTSAGGNAPGGNGGDGGVGGGEAGSGGAGSMPPVYVGISPNPLTTDGQPPSASDELTAELTAYAAGVGSMAIDVPWEDLAADELQSLAARVTAYRERGLRVALNLLVVDGHRAYRPTSVVGKPWDDPLTIGALESTLDAILAATSDELSMLLLARNTDVYVTQNPTEQSPLRGLLVAGIDHLNAALEPDLPNGVGLSFSEEPSSGYEGLLELGTVVALSYFPGLGATTFPAEASAAKDLDAMISMAGLRPIALQALGYPSAASLQSSDESQLQQLDAFFAALKPRRKSFALINIHQLHDLDATACEAFAADHGQGLGPWSEYLCATGLRDAQDEPKPAWFRFLQATAYYAGQ